MAAWLGIVLWGRSPVLSGGLVDSDSYMHLVRALDLWRDGDWFTPRSPRTNAPYGEILHWTRPFDVLLLAGAVPLRSVLGDMKQALFAWGAVLPPLLLVAALPPLRRAIRAYGGDGVFVLAVLLLLFQPQATAWFLPGRPDHHALNGLLFIATMAAALRLALRPDARLAFVAGLVGGLAVWISMEAVLSQSLLLAGLILGWLYGPMPERRRQIAAWLTGMAVLLSVALAAERLPSDWPTVQLTRVSVVHWLLAVSACLAWWGLERWRGGRWSALAIGIAVPATAVAAVAPDFFAGPWARMPEAVRSWHRTIDELQPLLPWGASAAKAVYHLGLPAMALSWLAWRGVKGTGDERLLALTLLPAGLGFFALSVHQERWSAYPQIVAILPGALLMARLAAWRPAGAGLAAIMPLAPLVLAASVAQPGRPAGQGCAWEQLAAWLNTQPPGVVMTNLSRGGELIWRTDWSVVGAPYDNEAAITATDLFFSGLGAKSVAIERGITLVAVCPDEPEGGGALRHSLADGEAPPWLEAVSGPAGFRAYRINLQ